MLMDLRIATIFDVLACAAGASAIAAGPRASLLIGKRVFGHRLGSRQQAGAAPPGREGEIPRPRILTAGCALFPPGGLPIYTEHLPRGFRGRLPKPRDKRSFDPLNILNPGKIVHV